MIRIIDYRDAQSLITRKTQRLEDAERIVAPILEDVRREGDAALLAYARKFDDFEGASVRIPVHGSLEPEFEQAVRIADANIREYARLQLPVDKMVEYPDGRKLGQIVRPLDSMGAYTPAGRYPLPSTLLMNIIPAQVAGVKTTCVACPHPSAEILGIAQWLGVTHFFQMGGAQAIAALAFGTATVPRVDRIVGPGNIYVAAAKKLIAGETGIDFVAGPTEIVIIAAEGNPEWIAADMLAQAEHDVDASAILLTTSRELADAVAEAIDRQLLSLPTAAVARQSIDSNGAIVIVDSLERAVEFSNSLAPEHLALHDPGAARVHPERGLSVSGSVEPRGRGRLRVRSQSRPSDFRPSPFERWPVRGGLRQSDFGTGTESGGAEVAGARGHHSCSRRRPGSARAIGRGAAWLTPLTPREAIRAMAPYSPPSAGRAGKLRLDFNENTVGCSPKVIECVQKYLTADHLTIYPEYQDARRDLGAFFGVSPEEFTITNGTDEAIQLLINTFVDDGDDVLLLKPSYAMYRFYAEVAGASVREVEYGGNLSFPVADFLDAMRPETRAILIANPNNPTGSAIGLDQIELILETAPDAAVLIDEAYFEFYGVTALRWINKYKNLFVSRTFSKVYGMAAMRCGCLFTLRRERRVDSKSAVAL